MLPPQARTQDSGDGERYSPIDRVGLKVPRYTGLDKDPAKTPGSTSAVRDFNHGLNGPIPPSFVTMQVPTPSTATVDRTSTPLHVTGKI